MIFKIEEGKIIQHKLFIKETHTIDLSKGYYTPTDSYKEVTSEQAKQKNTVSRKIIDIGFNDDNHIDSILLDQNELISFNELPNFLLNNCKTYLEDSTNQIILILKANDSNSGELEIIGLENMLGKLGLIESTLQDELERLKLALEDTKFNIDDLDDLSSRIDDLRRILAHKSGYGHRLEWLRKHMPDAVKPVDFTNMSHLKFQENHRNKPFTSVKESIVGEVLNADNKLKQFKDICALIKNSTIKESKLTNLSSIDDDILNSRRFVLESLLFGPYYGGSKLSDLEQSWKEELDLINEEIERRGNNTFTFSTD